MFSWLSRKILKLTGWNLEGEPPNIDKYVVIIAPHTSNWDFFIFLLVKFSYSLKVSFIGKHTIFIGPIGWLLRKIGGIPVNRTKNKNVVGTIVEAFDKSEKMVFALSPEGTRSYKDHWKTGFYHIALNANVPIQTCFLDAETRTLGFGPLVNLSGDIEKDFELFKQVYAGKKGIKQELFSKITFNKKN